MTLTLQEAANRLGVHYMTVYRWVRTGRLPAVKQGSAWAVDEADLDLLSEPEPEPARTRRVDHAERMTRRLLAGDEAGAMTVAETALVGGMNPEALYLDVLAVSMGRIGDSWDAGRASIADEHRATAIMHRLLGRLSRSFVRRGRRRGTIVLGAAPGDPHGLPSAFLADPLRGRSFTVIDLGADEMVRTLSELRTQNSAMTQRRTELQKVVEQFDADIKRFKELRTSAAARGPTRGGLGPSEPTAGPRMAGALSSF